MPGDSSRAGGSKPGQKGSGRRLRLASADASRALVDPFAAALEAAGFSVDDSPADHAGLDDAIAAADAVIVCWTPAAVASDAVNLEAARARRAGKLVSVLLAPCTPAASHGGRLAVTDLSGWRSDPSDPELLALVQSLHARFGGQIISGEFWRSRLFSWGGAGALSVAAITLLVNFGALRQTFDGLFNPAATERTLSATDAKVDQVLALLVSRSGGALDASSEGVMRASISELLSTQSGERGRAALKLGRGDIEGALADLQGLAAQGETAAADLSATWSQIGALTFTTRTWDAIHAYRRAIELSPSDHDSHSQLGHLYVRVGRLEDAHEIFSTIYQNIDHEDEAARGRAASDLGMALLRLGDLGQAEGYLIEALAAADNAGDVQTAGFVEADLGELAIARGDLDAAEQRFARALALHLEARDRHGEATAIALAALLARQRGDLDAAQRELTRALAIYESLNDPDGRAFALGGLGDIAQDRGDRELARRHFTQALELAREISASEVTAMNLVRLGELAEQDRDNIAAIEAYREARFLYGMIGVVDVVDELEARMARNGATPHPEGAED